MPSSIIFRFHTPYNVRQDRQSILQLFQLSGSIYGMVCTAFQSCFYNDYTSGQAALQTVTINQIMWLHL